jgi:hypothetical protein
MKYKIKVIIRLSLQNVNPLSLKGVAIVPLEIEYPL